MLSELEAFCLNGAADWVLILVLMEYALWVDDKNLLVHLIDES